MALLNSSADTDEGLYFLVTRSLLAGHLPYIDVWECKPPLFFLLLGGFAKIFGLSVVTFRLATDVAVFASACGIYRIGLLFSARPRLIGVTAALAYAGLTTSDAGLAAEAELFFAPFVIWAAAFVLESAYSKESVDAGRVFGIAILLSAATQIKGSAFPEAAYFALIVLIYMRYGIRQIAAAVAGAVLPVVIGLAPYALSGTIAFYLDANLWTFVRRLGVPSNFQSSFTLVRQELEAFFPSFLLAPLIFFTARSLLVAVIAGWAIVDLIVLLVLREFSYQSLPLMAPLSILGAAALVLLIQRRQDATKWAIAVALLTLVAHSGGQFVEWGNDLVHRIVDRDPTYGDDVAKLGVYLDAHRGSGDWLYVADDQAVVYLLANAPVPTRFPLPEHLIDARGQAAAGVNGPREIQRIFDLGPRYVVYRGLSTPGGNRSLATIITNLRQHYRRVQAFGVHGIYRLSNP